MHFQVTKDSRRPPRYRQEKNSDMSSQRVLVTGYAYPEQATLGGEGVVLKVTAVSGTGPAAALPVIFRIGQAEYEAGGQRFAMDVAS